jgi:transcriptional regulator with XRE-family HTH domain
MPRGYVTPDGSKIARLRGEAGLTQSDLAELAGFGLRTIGKIEGGQRTVATTLSAVATVLDRKLQRRVTLGDLLQADRTAEDGVPAAAPTELVVVEHVKVLDLRSWHSGAGEGPAVPNHGVVLFDRVRFRRLPANLGTLTFHYATTGTGLRGQSLSHPGRAQWREINDFGSSGVHATHLNRCFALCVEVGESGEAGAEFHNRVEYVDGFSGREDEWFHTHVVYATECLTLMLLFPPHKPFRSVRGLFRQHPAAPFAATAEQPIGIPEGELAYWRLQAPQIGEMYQIEWRW